MNLPTSNWRLAEALRAITLVAATGLATRSLAAAEVAKPTPVDAEQIAQLIANLGDDSFATREKATGELTAMGWPALAALEAAARHPDREVRNRSLRVAGLIRQRTSERRLEAFLAGKEDKQETPLPGWTRFSKAYGDDTQSRTLFVEIQRADAELLQALEAGPRLAAEVLAQRAAQHQQAQQLGLPQASLGQVSAALFVAAEEDVSLPVQTAGMVFRFCQQQGFREAVEKSSRGGIPRKMLAGLIRRSDGQVAYLAMNIAMQFNLPEGIVPATNILNNPLNRVPHMTQFALMTVARLGDSSHLPLVEKLLEDQTVLTSVQQDMLKREVQVRDMALAAAVVLTKQELSSYFESLQPQEFGDLQQVFLNPRVIGFENEQQRSTVFEKWSRYKANPLDAAQPKAAEKPAPQP